MRWCQFIKKQQAEFDTKWKSTYRKDTKKINQKADDFTLGVDLLGFFDAYQLPFLLALHVLYTHTHTAIISLILDETNYEKNILPFRLSNQAMVPVSPTPKLLAEGSHWSTRDDSHVPNVPILPIQFFLGGFSSWYFCVFKVINTGSYEGPCKWPYKWVAVVLLWCFFTQLHVFF